MSIETKLARAMSNLDERGVLVLQDPEIDTTRFERVGRGWRISRSYDDPDDDASWVASWVVNHRADVETEIRSWFKSQEQIDSL